MLRFWCWKADREQSDRVLTAILYLNPDGWEKDIPFEGSIGGSEGGAAVQPQPHQEEERGAGGHLRLFPGAARSDRTGATCSCPVDVAPKGGRLVLFDSK